VTVQRTREGELAVITIDSPPVNALSHAVRAGLMDALQSATNDPSVSAIILAARGTVFVGGADMTEFGAPRKAPVLNTVCDAIEQSDKPVVAAIHGAALGGGCELAMAAHARVAGPRAEFALPEILLGLMPGAGGTQRAPRLMGVDVGLPWMLSGRRMSAQDALTHGLIDRVSDDPFGEACACARTLIVTTPQGGHPRQTSVPGTPEEQRAAIAASRSNLPRAAGALPAAAHIIAAVELACTQPHGATAEQQATLFAACLQSAESRALVHLFFAERAAATEAAGDGIARTIEHVGVVGGGTMGAGIAQALLDAGLRVSLVEQDAVRSQRAHDTVATAYATLQSKGRLNADATADRLARLSCGDDRLALADVDVVIEAVFEDVQTKRDLFAGLSSIWTALLLAGARDVAGGSDCPRARFSRRGCHRRRTGEADAENPGP
jgi:3-hydroxyacyl-CoA dehydrogenase